MDVLLAHQNFIAKGSTVVHKYTNGQQNCTTIWRKTTNIQEHN